MRTSIWLIRHVQTAANRQQRYQSHSDSPITAYGQRQQVALAQRLRRIPFDTVLSSAAERTRSTAAAILAGRQHAPAITVVPAWSETHHGRWEGLTYREVVQQFPDDARLRFGDPLHGRAPDGESLAEVAARVQQGWQAVLHDYLGGRILIVTHATPIRLVLCMLTGVPIARQWQWRVDTGSITALDVYGSDPIIRMVNEVPRL